MPYSDLRIGRASIPDQTYLVTTVTMHRQRLFDDFMLGRIVVNEIRTLDEAAVTRTLAFVVMPDHVHWLFELGSSKPLSQLIKVFKGRTAISINRHLRRSGSIWQPSFHDYGIRTEESLVEVARYVVMNPVRAGLVNRVGDYPLWDCIWME